MKSFQTFRLVRRAGLFAALANPITARAQDPPELLPKLSVVATDFSYITSVRELSDGRLLVTDFRAKQLLAVDPKTNRSRVVGRVGDGPGEYRAPRELHDIGTDSTVLFSSGRRWQLLILDKFAPSSGAIRSREKDAGYGVVGIDRAGNILRLVGVDKLKPTERPRWTEPVEQSVNIAALRVTVSGRLDTVARLRGGFVREPNLFKVKNAQDILEIFELGSGLVTSEQAVIFADGTIAFALQNPYRIDWLLPSGAWVRGRPVNEAEVIVTAAVKKQVASEHRMKGVSPDNFAYWPRFVPPFGLNALMAGTDGRVYVRRMQLSSLSPVAFDVFDQAGKRVAFAIPRQGRLVGSGKRGLYVVIKDEDDIETLTLFATPK